MSRNYQVWFIALADWERPKIRTRKISQEERKVGFYNHGSFFPHYMICDTYQEVNERYKLLCEELGIRRSRHLRVVPTC